MAGHFRPGGGCFTVNDKIIACRAVSCHDLPYSVRVARWLWGTRGRFWSGSGPRSGGSDRPTGLSLHELARLSGISGSALSLIETGKRDARLSTLDRIARSLGTGVGAFFDHPPQAAPAPGVGGGYDLDELE